MANAGAMAVGQLAYMIDIRVNTGVKAILEDLDRKFARLEKRFIGLERATKRASSGFKDFQKSILALGLSTLFLGMQLKMLGD
jgi:hypothetical protein